MAQALTAPDTNFNAFQIERIVTEPQQSGLRLTLSKGWLASGAYAIRQSGIDRYLSPDQVQAVLASQPVNASEALGAHLLRALYAWMITTGGW